MLTRGVVKKRTFPWTFCFAVSACLNVWFIVFAFFGSHKDRVDRVQPPNIEDALNHGGQPNQPSQTLPPLIPAPEPPKLSPTDFISAQVQAFEQRNKVAERLQKKTIDALLALPDMTDRSHDCLYLLEHCYAHQYSALPPPDLKQPLVYVMGVSGAFADIMKHSVGSIHIWDPNAKIIVYNLGSVKDSQVNTIKTWCNVELRQFPFEKYPPHLRNLQIYAWKPLIIQETAKEFGVVFWLDASVELRGDLVEIKEHIYWDGYFVSSSNPYLDSYTHPGMFEWFAEKKEDPKWRAKDAPMMTSAAALGIRYPSPYYTQVLQKVVNCALDVNCIAPQGATKRTHRYDQAAFSLAMYQHGYPVTADHRFNAHRTNDPFLSPDPRNPNSNINLLTRRGGGGPYVEMIKKCQPSAEPKSKQLPKPPKDDDEEDGKQ